MNYTGRSTYFKGLPMTHDYTSTSNRHKRQYYKDILSMPIKEFNIYDVWHPVYYLHHESFLRPLKMWVRFILIHFLPHFNLFFVWKPMRFIKVFVNQQKQCFQNSIRISLCKLPFVKLNITHVKHVFSELFFAILHRYSLLIRWYKS